MHRWRCAEPLAYAVILHG